MQLVILFHARRLIGECCMTFPRFLLFQKEEKARWKDAKNVETPEGKQVDEPEKLDGSCSAISIVLLSVLLKCQVQLGSI